MVRRPPRGFRSAALAAAASALFGCSDVAPGESAAASSTPIVGGTADSTSHGVFAIQNDAGGLCSGSLIAPNLIMTAQHCVAELADPEAPVECGVTQFTRVYPASAFLVSWDADLSNGATQDTIHEVNLVVTPPSQSLCGNDIALLRLSDNLPASEATPIVPRVDSRPTVDELFDAIGYGIQNPNDNQGATAGERMRADDLAVGCVGVRDCANVGTTGGEWAAEVPICSGDSGGPALDAQGRVIGIASRGDPDCTIGIYTGVDSWKTLIVDTAVDAADDGGYDPPGWTGTVVMDGGVPVDAGMDAGMMDASVGMDAGNPIPDAGPPDSDTPDASPPDSGVLDAGTPPDSGTPFPDSGAPGDASVPMPDAGGGTLGSPCNGACAPGYQCWAANNEPPGICVPPCDTSVDCPDGYRCSTALDVCTPRTDDDDDTVVTSAGCGCRTAPQGQGTAWAFVALLLGAGTLGRRRAARTGRPVEP